MPVENTTPNRGYQLPFASNDLADDVGRLIAAITAVDLDVAAMLVSIAGKALAAHSHVIADTTGLQAALDSKQDESEKGNANGYASLDASGKLPAAQLPAALFGALSFQSDWNANTNTPTIPAAAPANKGWYYMVSTAGATNVGGITDWKVGDWAVSDGTKWTKIDNTDAVVSVAGLVGAITAASLKTALAIAVADITDASTDGRSLMSAANYAAMRTALGLAIGTDVQAYDTNTMKKNADQAMTGGVTQAAVSDGSKSSGTYTPTPSGGNFRKITNNGAFTMAAPTASGSYNLEVDITNGASAGAIAFSGFATGYPRGDGLTTTNGGKFKVHISKTDTGVTALIEAVP